MKFASFRHQGRDGFGLVAGKQVVDLGHAGAGSLKQYLAQGGAARAQQDAEQGRALAIAEVQFLPVIPDPEKILCVGINYLSHVKETGRELPKHPMIFARFADSQTGHLQPIIRPHASEKLDFEGELAVVIGRKARHVKAAEALDYVAGYACYNDGSVRDWQKHTIQFIPGKNFPQTGGFGPWLVTPDEAGDPSQLSLVTRLNGTVVQEARTDDLIFPIPALIEYCSTFTELNPGDVIITGTTGGVGAFREPPLWMKPGDVVEVEISGLGKLVNPIAQEA
ncbi:MULTISPECIES: fumarylacetoacetate hydrolase family protein [unclassified Herbaspirillum]|uniref:fumarylacetoacetate hydrolase family protein n=1 Tax=unclassified Herbaspirillum TaxID=2624150 RepID=UPI00114F1136|nr:MULTISPECIES: fumarylacetoacetate hydrolase family protein [unclassified Herbaspirillum]MBB5391252.1 2-keto-4-pentenoate hydratase/2-oxohepta-3-ene-1,7-dioic acid hydratase in catechol pathway [Herbaspirillum sp. SJZ102]TQK13060.1 2-keto-4-pentenoate hydratase/2-oxohepta-3-ene-1,7-dioic acid hydratase in catechol pathway [Herbaspirillum sp. SJZ130]TQK15064.1 2-keto-4-pentenoate hydratase/2-oxohepta-3-ene-1,7-dioic acid hydratase in catechol pathway [Herbaspirillum sp. SJZ106]